MSKDREAIASARIGNPDYVRPLAAAENQFLQVLVDHFRIRRRGNGFELQVAFGEDSPSIWLRSAKRHLLSALPLERRRSVQEKMDAFFASNDEELVYNDSSYPFRLGNGGTLPIVRLNGADYYCLFFRDSFPTGWNIANGGANNRHELLCPDMIVERELREELIIVEPEKGWRYVFDWHDARLRDHPDFALANERWTERFRRQGFRAFDDVPLPLKWSIPPDADYVTPEQSGHDAMRIRCGDEPPLHTDKGFLNINAEDFGIEFDRIAKLSVGPEAVFCDGELRGSELLNRVIGLFAVGRMREELAAGGRHFLPDRTYWCGEDRTREDPIGVINAFLQARGSSWAKLEDHLKMNAGPHSPQDALDLCPVTRRIIGRHLQLREWGFPFMDVVPFDVFVSFASEDSSLAKRVFHHIESSSDKRAFCSDVTKTAGAFADQIDFALDSASAFVAVGSRVEHLDKSWVKYEWRNFHNDMNSGRKSPNAPFFAFVIGVDPRDLPRPLRLQQAIVVDPADQAPAFSLLIRYISGQHGATNRE